jgi:hypothetical protein
MNTTNFEMCHDHIVPNYHLLIIYDLQLYRACDIAILTSDPLFDPSRPRCYLLIHCMLRIQQIVVFLIKLSDSLYRLWRSSCVINSTNCPILSKNCRSHLLSIRPANLRAQRVKIYFRMYSLIFIENVKVQAVNENKELGENLWGWRERVLKVRNYGFTGVNFCFVLVSISSTNMFLVEFLQNSLPCTLQKEYRLHVIICKNGPRT